MAVLIGVLVGLLLGLTGAGGSVVAVPLLVYILGLSQPAAAGLSLAAVGLSALFGLLLRLGRRQIIWMPGMVLAVSGALLAPAGQWLGHRLDSGLVMMAFAVLVLTIAVRMWRQAKAEPEMARVVRGQPGEASVPETACRFSDSGRFEMRLPCLVRVILAGMLTGLLSGLFGVGGGFIVVPALMMLVGLTVMEAVATSLLVIVIVAGSGFASASLLAPVSLPLLAQLAAGSLLGMLLGSLVARKLAGPGLQRFFVVVLVLVAVATLARELVGMV